MSGWPGAKAQSERGQQIDSGLRGCTRMAPAMISPAPPAARACRYLIVRSLHSPLMSKLLWCALTATRLATSTGPILIGLKRCGYSMRPVPHSWGSR